MVDKKMNGFLEKLKEKAKNQENYGGKSERTEAQMGIQDCPACGAGRAKQDGLTHCAYCGFEFIQTPLTDGIFIKKQDNSQ